jgi:exodeoxyribonuclease VII small subunit
MPAEPTDPPEADGADQLGYAEAVAELEEILAELDGDEVDVDVLADRVRRAAELVRLCRRRLDAARVEVTRIVADLEAVGPVGDGGGDPGDASGGDEGPGGLFAAEG